MKDPEFHRIRRLPPYVFGEVNRLKAAARAAGRDIVDLGMGNPDSPTPPHIVAKLVEAVQDPRTHRYSSSKGIPGLRRALAGYYARRFGVQLDPETEVVATLGSKEGLANLANAIASPGDTILVPNPSYPIHQFGFIIAGASVRSLPCAPDDEMLAAIDRAVAEQGLGLAPGAAFGPEGEGWLRWCFASGDPARLDLGLQRLADALRL